MPFGAKKSAGLKKPKFGGRPKTSEGGPDKKILESFGGARPKGKEFEMRTQGNRETGFIQNTPKKATGAMMGRPPPPLIGGGPPRKDAKKAFKKAKGRKVF
jgi:hypothetical protein